MPPQTPQLPKIPTPEGIANKIVHETQEAQLNEAINGTKKHSKLYYTAISVGTAIVIAIIAYFFR